MNFQPIKFTFVTIAAILLSIGFILNISVSWSHNSTSLQLLKALDIERSIADNYENLYLKPSHSLTDLETKLKNPCQSLWYSRLVALFDLTVAKQYLVYSQACSRQNLIQRWQGLISWRLGEKEDAFNYWSVFAPSLLVDWGRSLVLADEAVLGQSLLQAVETQNPEMVLDLQYQIKLYETLGNLSLQSGDETKAIFYYLKVWEYSGSRYDNAAYHLGQSYAVQGQCQQAINIWEEALSNKTAQILPTLDSSFYISLASCHGELNDKDKAQEYLDAAKIIVDFHAEDLGEVSFKHQKDWIERVQEGLSSK